MRVPIAKFCPLVITKDTCEASGIKCPKTCNCRVPLTFVVFPLPVTVAPMTSLWAGEAEFDPREKLVVKP